MRATSLSLVGLMLGAALAASCGGGSTEDAAADDGAGAGSGASAGSSGKAGAGGAGAGAGGKAGTGGAGAAGAAGQAGSSGTSGSAGATGGAAGTGGSAGATGGAAGKGGSAGTAGAGGVTLTVSVAPAATTATVTLGVAPAPVTFKATSMQGNGAPMDVTAQSAWSLSGGSVGSVAAGVVTLSGTAGLSDVVATYAGSAGTAKLTVKLQGEAAAPGVDLAKAGAQFAAAKPDASSPVPTLEYPLPGVLLPANLPAIDAQWAKDGDSTLYRVKLVSSLVDLTVYTDKAELAFPDAIWTAFKAHTGEPEVHAHQWPAAVQAGLDHGCRSRQAERPIGRAGSQLRAVPDPGPGPRHPGRQPAVDPARAQAVTAPAHADRGQSNVCPRRPKRAQRLQLCWKRAVQAGSTTTFPPAHEMPWSIAQWRLW